MDIFTIAIDASRAVLANRTGIEEYSYRVIKSLRDELADERVVLYVRKQSLYEVASSVVYFDFDVPKNWEIRAIYAPRLWTQFRLALEMWIHPPEVLLVPAHTVPWIHPKKTVVVVHGLEYEFCPEAYSWWERRYMRWSIRSACRWASRIIAVSENTKRDLIRLYGIAEEKISVVYEGIKEDSHASVSSKRTESNTKQFTEYRKCAASLVEQFFLSDRGKKPYFFFVGRIEHRKNISRMIEAFALVKKRCALEYALVLAGGHGYGYHDIARVKRLSSYASDIIELGYVSDDERRELFIRSSGLVFPSLYEGFGLPILEAQMAGIPVLTSNTSSLPEVAGENGAIFVDPSCVESIADGMEKLALNTVLRSGILENGRRNTKRFSWEQCAKEIADVVRSA